MVTTTKFTISIPLNRPYQYLFYSKHKDNNPTDQSPGQVYQRSENKRKDYTRCKRKILINSLRILIILEVFSILSRITSHYTRMYVFGYIIELKFTGKNIIKLKKGLVHNGVNDMKENKIAINSSHN